MPLHEEKQVELSRAVPIYLNYHKTIAPQGEPGSANKAKLLPQRRELLFHLRDSNKLSQNNCTPGEPGSANKAKLLPQRREFLFHFKISRDLKAAMMTTATKQSQKNSTQEGRGHSGILVTVEGGGGGGDCK